MKIVLTAAQQSELLAWAAQRTRAEMEADMEPSGYTLEVEMGPVPCARARAGRDDLDLGAVSVEMTS